jgi:DNA-binding NarL/FixJ family response regulator
MQLLKRLSDEQDQGEQQVAAKRSRPPIREDLTPREEEVLRLLAQGQTNPQISRSVLSSVSTVKIHVQSIISKLGVSDRTQAAVRAIELGLATSGIEEDESLQRGRRLL